MREVFKQARRREDIVASHWYIFDVMNDERICSHSEQLLVDIHRIILFSLSLRSDPIRNVDDHPRE